MARKPRNETIAAAQLSPSEISDRDDSPSPEHEPRDMIEFLGLAAEIAQDTFYLRNHRWPGAREDFQFEPALRTCEKFFKEAKGGPLYIDEPLTPKDRENCERKAKALRARGLRYCYIYRTNGLDPDIEDVLAQLGGLRGVA